MVLIVDDDRSLARSMVRLLTVSGFDAHPVHGGAEALAFLRSHAVSLVVLDMMMTDMSGVDVLRALRVADGPPPVVMFAGTDTPALRVEAIHLGAIDVIPKNDPGKLLRVVETYAPRTNRPPF
jgi:DNA-binding response OmpR family regulator